MSHPELPTRKPAEETEPEQPGLDSEIPEEQDDAVIGQAFRRSIVVIAFLVTVGAASAWWWNQDVEPTVAEEQQIDQVEVRQAPEVQLPEIPFVDVTEASGIDFVHENGAAGEKLLPETMGGGCAFLDIDADGDQDILFINSQHWSWDAATEQPATMRLYANDGTGRFTDVTAKWGLDFSAYGMGCAIGDFDNDGHIDVYITTLGRNILLRNTGEQFVDITEQAGVAGAPDDWTTSAGFFDYDRDGDLDLLAVNYLVWSRELDQQKNFTLDGTRRAYGRPQEFGGTIPLLFRNEGSGRFVEMTAAAGLEQVNPTTNRPMAKSLGLAIADINADNWPDVIVANDTVQNQLFVNQQDGTFREQAVVAGIAYDVHGQARGAMGIDVGYFRDAELPGVAIGNFSNEMTALYVVQKSVGGVPQFSDEAVANGLGPATRLKLTFGLFFLDADLDGRLDLFAANGHLEEEIHLVQDTQHYAQPPQLIWNCGKGSMTEFVPLSADKCGADLVKPIVGRGAAYADIDGDGDLDVLVTASGGPPRLLRNDQQSGHNWIRFRLQGNRSNRSAIGAEVVVETDSATLRRTVNPTRSYLSQCELPVTFGIGQQSIRAVRINWPDGTSDRLADFEINTENQVTQKAER